MLVYNKAFTNRSVVLRLHGDACSVLYQCHQHPGGSQWSRGRSIADHRFVYCNVQLRRTCRPAVAGSPVLTLLHPTLHCYERRSAQVQLVRLNIGYLMFKFNLC